MKVHSLLRSRDTFKGEFNVLPLKLADDPDFASSPSKYSIFVSNGDIEIVKKDSDNLDAKSLNLKCPLKMLEFTLGSLMLNYDIYKDVFNGKVKDSKSPYFPYFSKELTLIEKNTDDIQKCRVLSAKNLTRLAEKAPSRVPPRLDYLICSDNDEAMNTLQKILFNNYQESLAELPESEYPFLEDDSMRQVTILKEGDSRFSDAIAKLMKKELALFTESPKVSTHLTGFRYSLVSECKEENVDDLRFIEGSPPQSVCCAKFNIQWVITRRSSITLCSRKKMLFECKFEIKLLRRKILEKCKFESEFSRKIEEAKQAADLEKAKKETAEDSDRLTPWKSPVDEKKELEKFQETEKQKQAQEEEKLLIQREKSIEEAKRLEGLVKKPRSEGDEKKEMAKELENQLDAIVKESESKKSQDLDTIEAPNIQNIEKNSAAGSGSRDQAAGQSETKSSSQRSLLTSGSTSPSSQENQGSFNPSAGLESKEKSEQSASSSSDSISDVNRKKESSENTKTPEEKPDQEKNASLNLKEPESHTDHTEENKLPAVTKEDINNAINKKTLTFDTLKAAKNEKSKDPHVLLDNEQYTIKRNDDGSATLIDKESRIRQTKSKDVFDKYFNEGKMEELLKEFQAFVGERKEKLKSISPEKLKDIQLELSKKIFSDDENKSAERERKRNEKLAQAADKQLKSSAGSSEAFMKIKLPEIRLPDFMRGGLYGGTGTVKKNQDQFPDDSLKITAEADPLISKFDSDERTPSQKQSSATGGRSNPSSSEELSGSNSAEFQGVRVMSAYLTQRDEKGKKPRWEGYTIELALDKEGKEHKEFLRKSIQELNEDGECEATFRHKYHKR